LQIFPERENSDSLSAAKHGAVERSAAASGVRLDPAVSAHAHQRRHDVGATDTKQEKRDRVAFLGSL
jgi:hypothetical protein